MYQVYREDTPKTGQVPSNSAPFLLAASPFQKSHYIIYYSIWRRFVVIDQRISTRLLHQLKERTHEN